jgi:sirohydrochlorin ferrochelatase
VTAPLLRLPGPRAANPPALLAIGHGSRDPRHAASLRRLARAVGYARPDVRVEVGFLDLCGPDVSTALETLVASGARSVAVLPLFLAHGYHVRHDVPRAVARAAAGIRNGYGRGRARGWAPHVAISEPLGPDPLLSEAMDARLREAGIWPTDPELGLIVASAGSSDAAAVSEVEDVARSCGPAVNAYASTPPTTAQAIARLRARGFADIAVASYLLAPGRLPDRVRADALAAGVLVATPLTTPDGEPPAELVRLVLGRYKSVTAGGCPSRPNIAAA